MNMFNRDYGRTSPVARRGIAEDGGLGKTIGSGNSKEFSGIEIRKSVSPPWVSPDGKESTETFSILDISANL